MYYATLTNDATKSFTMTIEGRPELIGTDEYWQKTYAEQRKDRMQDAIDDYLQDDKVSARQTYEEMLSCVQDVIDYHKTQLDRAVELKSLMMGHRPMDDMDELAAKWQYDKLPERY